MYIIEAVFEVDYRELFDAVKYNGYSDQPNRPYVDHAQSK